jgi:hypothetical protein
MRKLGTWLGIVALALQLAWPLLVSAKPKSVTLVPLCTVDGVTHYLEVPTGKTPLDESSAHHGDHCPLCFLGHAAALTGGVRPLAGLAAAADRPRSALPLFAPWTVVLGRDARGPPSASPAV